MYSVVAHSRLVNSSLEIFLHLLQLCSSEFKCKMTDFNNPSPTENQQKYSLFFSDAWSGQHCTMLLWVDATQLSFLIPSPQGLHSSIMTNIITPSFLPQLSILLSQTLSFAQLGLKQQWFLQTLIYEWYRQSFGNFPLLANILLCRTPAFNSRERKQPSQ